MIKLFGFVSLLFIAIACDTTSPETAGQKMSLKDLDLNPGFSWYQTEVGIYTPSPEMVDTLKAHFDSTNQKVCIFVRPSCGCRGTQKLFPRIMRTLLDANVDASHIEVWSMRSPGDNTPYKSQVALSSLPTIVVFRNGTEVSRIIDADFNDVNADTLIAEAITK